MVPIGLEVCFCSCAGVDEGSKADNDVEASSRGTGVVSKKWIDTGSYSSISVSSGNPYPS